MTSLLRASLFLATLAAVPTCLAGGWSMAGTWMVIQDGKANQNMKLVFTQKGEFRFVGANYSSSGQYTVNGNTVRLLWTKVDNQPVKVGSMKKDLSLSLKQTFTIDRYTYGRSR